MKTSIVLKQKPIIEHQLVKVGSEVAKRISDLNLEKQVVTPDTIQALKKLRAELNKELSDYESQRKTIKSSVNDPYSEFEKVYKTEIAEKYDSAVNTLKTKIGEFEVKLKEEKLNNIKSYFSELCIAEEIDFIEFEKVGIKIDLSTTEKKYKEKCNVFIEKIKDDISLIESQEHKVEILVEFKATLNASKAITDIVSRKQKEAEEKERIKQAEYLRRSKLLINLGMKADKDTESYVFNDEIYLVWAKVKDLKLNDFTSKVAEIEEQIKSYKSEEQEKLKSAEVIETEPTGKPMQSTFSAPISATKKTEPIKAPEKTQELDTVTAKFEVSGTLPVLKALGQYMRDNNITYKNLKDE